MRLRAAPWAASELDVQRDVLDIEDRPEVVAVLERWDGSALDTGGIEPWVLHRGLTELANACDEVAEHHTHPEVRAHARWARDGLTGLASRVVRRG